MAGNTTLQAIRTLLISALDGKLGGMTNLAGMNTFLAIAVISLAIHIVSLKWFDSIAKNNELTKMIRILEYDNEK